MCSVDLTNQRVPIPRPDAPRFLDFISLSRQFRRLRIRTTNLSFRCTAPIIDACGTRSGYPVVRFERSSGLSLFSLFSRPPIILRDDFVRWSAILFGKIFPRRRSPNLVLAFSTRPNNGSRLGRASSLCSVAVSTSPPALSRAHQSGASNSSGMTSLKCTLVLTAPSAAI
jgi:hypothetical protein